ncbi:MAG: hypothetical protein EFKGCFLK_01920 [Rhodocyclaceae bacterium]|nr:hypothetical protein [Rhodocyclaceae bacterium]CAG0929830.1 hypothetical protein RHDC3_01359 [Rhodocyclaceae bacterium]
MIAEGKLDLDLAWDGQRITAAKVRSTRPVFACRILEGRTVEEALRLAPMLFSVCGRAQAVAAAAAVDTARGIEADAQTREERERAIAAECLHEYVWRLFIDLPALLGEAARPGDLADLRRRMPSEAGEAEWLDIAADAEELIEQRVFGLRARDWLAFDEARFARWVEDGALPTARMLARLRSFRFGAPRAFLPWLDESALREEIAPQLAADPTFAAKPLWRGRPAETGALARQHRQPRVAQALAASALAARLLARLAELAALPAQLRRPQAAGVRSVQVEPGVGIAAVETARGTLIHRVALEGGRVSRYAIVAPTEWNFHPRGAFACGLAHAAARDENEARQAAALLAHALDPCVAYEVRINA